MAYLAKPHHDDASLNSVFSPQPILLYDYTKGSGTVVRNLGTSGATWDAALVDTPAWGTITSEGPYVRFIDALDKCQYGTLLTDISTLAAGTLAVVFVPKATTSGQGGGGGAVLRHNVFCSSIVTDNGRFSIAYDASLIAGSSQLTVRFSQRSATAGLRTATVTVTYTSADQSSDVPVVAVMTWNTATPIFTGYVNSRSNTATDANIDGSRIVSGAVAFTGGSNNGTEVSDTEVLSIGIWDSVLSDANIDKLFQDPYQCGRRKAPLDSEALLTCRQTTTGVTAFLTTETGDTTVRNYRVKYGVDINLPTTTAAQTSSGSATSQRLAFSLTAAAGTPTYAYIEYEITNSSGRWTQVRTTSVSDGSTYGSRIDIATSGARASTYTGTLKFCFITDPHLTLLTALSYTRLQNAATVAVAKGCEFCVCLGDLGATQPASQAAMDTEYALMRNLLRPFTDVMPFYLAPGNWDISNDSPGGDAQTWALSAILRYFGNPTGLSATETYWLLENGPMVLAAIDCYSDTTSKTVAGWQLGTTQRTAVNNGLAGSARPWALVGGHQCLGGDGANETASNYGRVGPKNMLVAGSYQKSTLHPDMKARRVVGEFFGHDHRAAAHLNDGIAYIECGTPSAKIVPAGNGYTGLNLLEGQTPYCIVVVSVTRSTCLVEFWQTSTGTAVTDESDAVAASNLLGSFYLYPPSSGAPPARIGALRNAGVRVRRNLRVR